VKKWRKNGKRKKGKKAKKKNGKKRNGKIKPLFQSSPVIILCAPLIIK
jgi:hypothetical protein